MQICTENFKFRFFTLDCVGTVGSAVKVCNRGADVGGGKDFLKFRSTARPQF